jgi:predicted membrane channel-forming protein YqfA (hemolysin III family)
MKKVPVVVTIVTLYAIFFQVETQIDTSEKIVFSMFLLSPFLVFYMVYVILKYGKPSGSTWDEKFYDDWDYKRNGKEEMES